MPIDPMRTPETPSLRPTALTKPEAPEVIERRLATAWNALDRHRENEGRRESMFLAAPACSAQCRTCDMTCSLLTLFVYQEWEAYQRALSKNGPMLRHGGRVYVTLAGRA